MWDGSPTERPPSSSRCSSWKTWRWRSTYPCSRQLQRESPSFSEPSRSGSPLRWSRSFWLSRSGMGTSYRACSPLITTNRCCSACSGLPCSSRGLPPRRAWRLGAVGGLTRIMGGVGAKGSVSAAVGAFLVGIAICGKVAENANQALTPLRDLFAALFFVFFGIVTDSSSLWSMVLPALALAAVTIATKVLTGIYAAHQAGIGPLGRWRTGMSLTPRGEFSIIIAGLAVTSGIVPAALAPLETTYVLITILAGPVPARIAG